MFSVKGVAIVTGVCVASFMVSTSASAESLEQDHYSFTESFVLPAEACGDVVDFPILDTTTYTGFFHTVRRGDGLVYEADHVRLFSTDTNLLNGKTLTFRQVNRGATQSIVDNGDGTSTLTFKNVGVLHVYGPDGSLLFKRAGQNRGEVLLDNGGTPGDQGDDQFLEFLGFTKTPHLDEWGQQDFCAVVAEYLG